MAIHERSVSSFRTGAGGRSELHRIRVLLADDEPLFRGGVAGILERGGMAVVAECGDGAEAIALFRHHRPDVMLTELRMPRIDGAEATAAIRRELAAAKIIVLTRCDGAEHIHRALQAGAQSYVFKTTTGQELLEIIHAVHAGRHKPLPTAVAARLAEWSAASALTPREVDVLERVAGGKTNKEIGAELHITEGTVKGHLNAILLKTGARDRTHAVVLALRSGALHWCKSAKIS
jgi:two-component system, NarL family, response regulator